MLEPKESMMIREMLGISEGILQDLYNDHSEVDSLFGRMMDSQDRAERDQLFSELKIKLLAHLQAEEEVLYQALEAGNDVESRLFGHEGISEHQIIEQQMHKMTRLDDRMSDEWTAELKVLRDLV